jgi:cubilin
VTLSFQQFDLTRSEHCNTDYVEVRKGDAMGELMAHACGNSIPNNLTASEAIWIRFRSGNLSVAPGFVAHYELCERKISFFIIRVNDIEMGFPLLS